MGKNFQTRFTLQEIMNMRKRFNNTLGQMKVCDLKIRLALMLSIIHLEMVGKRIVQSKNEVSSDLKEFIMVRNTLNNFFKMLEQQKEERRRHHGTTQKEQRTDKRVSISG